MLIKELREARRLLHLVPFPIRKFPPSPCPLPPKRGRGEAKRTFLDSPENSHETSGVETALVEGVADWTCGHCGQHLHIEPQGNSKGLEACAICGNGDLYKK